MNTINYPIRARVLAGTVRMLGCTVAACARGLLAAGVSPPDIDALLRGGVAVEHSDIVTERLLVLQVLDGPGSRSRSELEVALSDVEPLSVCDALTALEGEGVLYAVGEQIWVSRCARHLDELGIIVV